MGLNICVYRRDDLGRMRPQRWFDEARHNMDREFASYVSGENATVVNLGNDYDPEFYYRPKDCAVAREWVRTNVPFHMRYRFYYLLSALEADPALWLYDSV